MVGRGPGPGESGVGMEGGGVGRRRVPGDEGGAQFPVMCRGQVARKGRGNGSRVSGVGGEGPGPQGWKEIHKSRYVAET